MKTFKRNRYDQQLHRDYRWVRVGEVLEKGDQALGFTGRWGRTGRFGWKNFIPKAYRRRIR